MMVKYVKSPRGDYVVSLGSNNDLFASVIKNRGTSATRVIDSFNYFPTKSNNFIFMIIIA